MIKPGHLGDVLIRSKEGDNRTATNFRNLLNKFDSFDSENNLKASLSLIIICLRYFNKISQKNIEALLAYYKDHPDNRLAVWFNLDSDTDEPIFECLNKKAVYSFYNKKLTKKLRAELKQFTENHFEMEKTTKKGERVGLKLLYATLNGSDRRITPAKLHYRGFADVSQSKKSGKASSRLAKTIFR